MATLGELAWELGEPEIAARAHAAISPYRGQMVVSGFGAVVHGTVDRYLGAAELAMGRHDDAVRSLEAALAFAERVGAEAEALRAQSLLAHALRARGAAGDAARADALAASAVARAEELGAPGLAGGLSGRRRPDVATVAQPGTAQTASASPGAQPAVQRATLRREGDFWTLVFGSEVLRLRDTKGVGYLRVLLRHPGRELHALDLARGTEERTAAGDAGEAIDSEAARAYRRRLDELRREAEDAGDPDAYRDEIEALERELARATGLGGRSRRTGSDAERARLNVTRAIASVVRKIASACPEAGRHLEASVRTGTFCSYEPRDRAIQWDE
ncbi:MAG TPA: hypothetical protein VIS07_19855 [Candidatus Binatia bacterium]